MFKAPARSTRLSRTMRAASSSSTFTISELPSCERPQTMRARAKLYIFTLDAQRKRDANACVAAGGIRPPRPRLNKSRAAPKHQTAHAVETKDDGAGGKVYRCLFARRFDTNNNQILRLIVDICINATLSCAVITVRG